MNAAPGAARMFWLLTRLRLVRLLNITGTQLRFSAFRKRKGRQGSATKSKTGPVVAVMVLLLMLFSFATMARQGVLNLHTQLDAPLLQQERAAAPADSRDTCIHASNLTPGAFSPALLGGLTMMLSLLLCVSIFSDIGARELAKADWDMEWLVTLPIRMDTLLWGRIVERSVSSAFGLIAFWPLCGMIAWYSGYGWWSLLAGAMAMIPLLLMAALGRSMVDVGFRLTLSPPQLRNLQAVLSVVGLLGLYLALSVGSSRGGYGLALAAAFPEWATWLAPGLLVRSLNAQEFGSTLWYGLLLAAQLFLLLSLGVRWLRHQLRHGLVASGSRESARHVPRATVSSSNLHAWRLKSAVQRRELTLLGRDRNFMVQTLLLPIVIVGGQLAMNDKMDSLAHIWSSTSTTASVAFGIAAYMLMLSAFQNLNTEGAALWLLFSFPRSIASVLKEKAQLWAVLALAYPGLILLAGTFFTSDSASHYLWYSALALLGVAIYAVIAVALGVFASNPLAQEQGAKVRPSYLYLFMLLSGMYVYAIAAAVWWQSLVFVVLAILLALALWQKAADQLPFLLDPSAAPPARVSTSDGLIAAMMFFVVQLMIVVLLGVITKHKISGPSVLISFCGSGALTYLMVRLVYWRSKTTLVPSMFKGAQHSPWSAGIYAGAIAALVGLAYVWAVQRFGVLDLPPMRNTRDQSLVAWLLPLAIVAAPIFEEFIFRGLIFGGMRRSVGILPAVVASAAIFAAVHPPASILPVFALGICAALAYERSKALMAPMLTHAIYNAVVVGYQLYGPAVSV